MPYNFHNLLDRLGDDLANNISAESIIRLRSVLVDFLDEIEQLYIDMENSENVSKEDSNAVRQMIKKLGEIYLSIK